MSDPLQRITVTTLLIFSIILNASILAFVLSQVKADSTTIFVDDDNIDGPWNGSRVSPYQNITSGLENADSGDTLFVFNGFYVENVFLDKSVSIIGEDPANTVVDGNGTDFLSVIHIFRANNVIIGNLTVQNTASGIGVGGTGIYVWESSNITVTECIATRCYYGLILGNSTGCRVFRNIFLDNYAYGVDFRMGSCINSVIENIIANNPTGIYIEEASSQFNLLYRNNIMNNTNQVTLYDGLNFWDNGAEGNFWDDYSGSDLDGDGVGDSNFGVDQFPLMEFWSQTRTYPVNSDDVVVICNYTVASFEFNGSQKEISFYITGPESWNGFCSITIPIEVLEPVNSSEGWFVKVGSNPTFYQKTSVNNSTVIYFEYVLGASMLENWVQIMVVEGYFPVADFSSTPDLPIVSEFVVFEDLSIPGNGTILWRYWNFGDGVPCNTTEQIITHTYTDSGNFTVTLTVFDSLGFVGTISRTVMVIQHPTANFTYFPVTPLIGEEITFNGSTSFDPDGTITKYIWNFSDGSLIEEGVVVTHSFSGSGSYNVTLTVYDNHELLGSVTKIIDVHLENDYTILLVSASALIVALCLLVIWKKRSSE